MGRVEIHIVKSDATLHSRTRRCSGASNTKGQR